MSATKSHTLSDLVAEQRQRARDLILAYCDGGEIDPQEFLDVAILNGWGVHKLQEMAERVADRKRLVDQFHAAEFDVKIEAAKAERDSANLDNEAATHALTAARESAQQAGVRYFAAVQGFAALQAAKTDAWREFTRAMKATAGPGQDLTDWRNFSFV